MKRVLLTLVWMFVFLQTGFLLLIIVVGFLPLPSAGDFWLRLTIELIIALFTVGPVVLALTLSLKGILPGTRGFKPQTQSSASTTKAVPPPVARAASPPPIPKKAPSARLAHHSFTHEFIPSCFIQANNRSQYLKRLVDPELKGIMRLSWRQIAGELGEDPGLADLLDLTTFRNDPYLCGCWEFPPATHAGEAAAGLLVVGPLGEFASIQWEAVPVRYFILERAAGPTTRLLEWSLKGYQLIGPGPNLGMPITVFADMVFDRVMGKKRPSAEQVAKRLLILKHIGTYAQVVPLGQQLNAHPDVKEEAKGDLHTIFGEMFSKKLRDENLWDQVSPKEKLLLELHVKDIKPQQLINALWRIEAIQVLMWALGHLPSLPSYDTKANAEALKQIPKSSPAEFIASASLRDQSEIDRAREIAELWHWRSRTRQLQEEGRPMPLTDAMKSAGLDTYEAVTRAAVRMAVKDGGLPTSTGDDFLVYGKAYKEMTPDEWADVRSITMERHLTLNWLCGFAPANQWDNTPTDT